MGIIITASSQGCYVKCKALDTQLLPSPWAKETHNCSPQYWETGKGGSERLNNVLKAAQQIGSLPYYSVKDESQCSELKGGRCSKPWGLWMVRTQIQSGRDQWLILSNLISPSAYESDGSTDVMVVWPERKEKTLLMCPGPRCHSGCSASTVTALLCPFPSHGSLPSPKPQASRAAEQLLWAQKNPLLILQEVCKPVFFF